jgi:DNA polymerase III subunit alpha
MYIPTHLHSHYSFLDSSAKIPNIIEKIQQIGSSSCAITDHGNLCGSVQFSKECKKANIKPLLGIELNVTDYPSEDKSRRDYYHLILIAKNLIGWKQLLKIVSVSNKPENFYYKPRIDFQKIGQIVGSDSQIITFAGHLGSIFTLDVFGDFAKKIGNQPQEHLSSFVLPEYKKNIQNRVHQLKEIFGKENLFAEIQRIDIDNLPVSDLLSQIMREEATKNKLLCIGTGDSHYINKEDFHDHRVLLCTNLKTTLRQIEKQLLNDEDISLGAFFRSDNYYIHNYEEMRRVNTEEELKNTILLSDMCESYDITSKPILPDFPAPNGLSNSEYLTKLCRDGYRKKEKYIQKTIKEKKLNTKIYGERFQLELNTIMEAGLANYFLVVWDICRYAREKKILIGAGRGSVGGSLLAYLLDITNVDPLRYDLLWTRFYNKARNTKDRVSLPDIDLDFQTLRRNEIIEYLRNKYGHDKVAGIATFLRMQGRTCLKDVLRVTNACSFEEMNRITEYIFDEAKVIDQLQEIRDSGEEPSIIRLSLEENAKQLREWCWIDERGELQGNLCKYFELAIRLEGTIRGVGKHACGLIISPKPLDELAPLIYDKSNSLEPIVGLSKEDCEAVSMVKIDILGVTLLDKLNEIKQLLLR